MGQLSIALIIPAIVGLVTYVVVRLFWTLEKCGEAQSIA